MAALGLNGNFHNKLGYTPQSYWHLHVIATFQAKSCANSSNSYELKILPLILKWSTLSKTVSESIFHGILLSFNMSKPSNTWPMYCVVMVLYTVLFARGLYLGTSHLEHLTKSFFSPFNTLAVTYRRPRAYRRTVRTHQKTSHHLIELMPLTFRVGYFYLDLALLVCSHMA